MISLGRLRQHQSTPRSGLKRASEYTGVAAELVLILSQQSAEAPLSDSCECLICKLQKVTDPLSFHRNFPESEQWNTFKTGEPQGRGVFN